MKNERKYYTPPYEEHLELINELAKLQLWFLWNWLQEHPDEKFDDAVINRIDLCRRADPAPKHYDVADMDASRPEWLKIRDELAALYRKTVNDDTAESFENEAFNIVKETLAAFAEASYGKHGKFDDYQCGSLKYDPPKPESPESVTFHIGNAVAPKSIFSDRSYLPDCLSCLMDKTEREYNASVIKTSTWLNSLPKWLEYFPDEWRRNMGPEKKEVEWHFGFWGQFVSAKGSFNWKYARILRETGKMPFYPRASHCSFAALRAHLARIQK